MLSCLKVDVPSKIKLRFGDYGQGTLQVPLRTADLCYVVSHSALYAATVPILIDIGSVATPLTLAQLESQKPYCFTLL